MTRQVSAQAQKERALLPARGLASHAAVQPVSDREASPAAEVETRFDRNFTAVGVDTATPMVGERYGATSCPVFPRTCPFGGACHTCPTRVQAKLAIYQPGDEYEQEADRIAGQLTRAPGMPLRRQATGQVEPTTVPPIVHEVLRSPGQPLDAATRSFMEPRFGHDFSGVRVHTDVRAAESASAVNALAYTVGRDVAFGVGQYAPQTGAGRKLLAHELTHVVQQGSDSSPATAGNESRPLTGSPSQGALEVEAHRMAEGYNWHEPPVSGLSHKILQRQEQPAAAQEAPRICAVTAIAAYGPPDGPPVGNAGMTADTITAMNCLQTAVTAAGGTMHVTTRFRSQAYQDHLVEVWDKVNAPAHPEAECEAVMQNYAAERATHFPMGAPARGVSNHTNGTAFDATVDLPATANLNTIQAGCNLTRPVPGEPWHFET